MAMTAVRRKELVAAQRGANEPSLRIMEYQLDLMRALNYYNVQHDDKEKKKWFIGYIAKSDKKFAVALTKLDEVLFRHAGILARLVQNDNILEEKEALYLECKISELRILTDVKVVPLAVLTNVIPLPSIQDRIESAAHKHAAEFDAAIDGYIMTRSRDFSAKSYLLTNQISAPVAKRIGDLMIPLVDELREAQAGKDEQLVEGYSYFSTRELKKFIEYVDEMIADCMQQVQTAKANRIPRKHKPKPASMQTAKIKYLSEFPELGLKSVHPTAIIGSTEIWYYNTKYKVLGVLKGENGSTLAVKGTSIIGFDVQESVCMRLRKPADFFKGLSLNKRALNTAMKTLKTKPSPARGRLTEDCIILGAY